MFAIPGLLLLVLFIYVRPLEIIEPLRGTPLLYIFFALALFGLVLDLRLRKNRALLTPQFLWVATFAIWCLFTLSIRQPSQLLRGGVDLGICIVFYLLT